MPRLRMGRPRPDLADREALAMLWCLASFIVGMTVGGGLMVFILLAEHGEN